MSAKPKLKEAYGLYREIRLLDRLSVEDISDSDSAYLGRKAHELTMQLSTKYGHKVFSICERIYISKHHTNKYFNYEWTVSRAIRNGSSEADARFFRFRFAMLRINNAFGVSNKILKELNYAND